MSQKSRADDTGYIPLVCPGAAPLGPVVNGMLSAQVSWWDDQADIEGMVLEN